MLVQKEYPWHFGFGLDILVWGFKFGFETFWFWVWDILIFVHKKMQDSTASIVKKTWGLRLLAKIPAESGRPGFSVAKPGSPRNTQRLNGVGWAFPFGGPAGLLCCAVLYWPWVRKGLRVHTCYWRMRTFTEEHGSFVARMDTHTLLGRLIKITWNIRTRWNKWALDWCTLVVLFLKSPEKHPVWVDHASLCKTSKAMTSEHEIQGTD